MLNLIENKKYDLLFASLINTFSSISGKANSAIMTSHETVELLNSGGPKKKWTKFQGGIIGLGITVAVTAHIIGDNVKHNYATK